MGRLLSEFRRVIFRAVAVPSAALLIGIGGAIAQSGDLRAQDQPAKPAASNGTAPEAAAKESQRKTDEFAEAAQAINGPAGNPECVWLGRRVVSLMWRDDLDTAFRHLDLYDRFGCPGGHVQAAFRCLTRFGGTIDSKVPESLTSRVHACWINPNAQPQSAAAAAPAPAAPAAAATAPAATPPAAAAPAPAAPAK
ncbi:beta-1-3, beta-1-6-glucan biosynthesis protein [Bradyrhizobium sp. U87765 SZCCT0131]|uniref:beta-1-3, beta-1-6-glucan biosynthesis protein n=1 Tax=unclassified Bradyrhizobium TaxID=2631580 RepID=UPI001BAB55A5|nr:MULTISPECIES: beta-1-3, beta-1-6-glucan biosynthesis protein [unclassified Bradyrhizobium]MBR1220151.1 beta-1-3, beta-1-6-glucan biosynthesis protein [Bradyrhizobium sp. U87765 SZCCT0131]MBR1263393.1 beta-1-3, beta-1-6-glucan biosynthesis protein [Bradyrhizobium sp. U87765 SZCCT0134]MBR1306724.1 beta-1-3, beta-1-6-glucan biosynthesis protein [Bradyrhizobium sp. U87765 SZCCT0110]MBR1323223.1 beta-1-3, beta-1-6-glucan biosynthesis protein [Bradyrhizobium sp. U87765 SZCCT0109]MBR1345678.1 beta